MSAVMLFASQCKGIRPNTIASSRQMKEREAVVMNQSLNPRSRRPWLITLGALGVLLAGLICLFWPAQSLPLDAPGSAGATSSLPTTLDRQALRDRAWAKIAPRLDQADQAATREIDASLKRLNDFFADRKVGIRPFAGEILSLRGKWAFVR